MRRKKSTQKLKQNRGAVLDSTRIVWYNTKDYPAKPIKQVDIFTASVVFSLTCCNDDNMSKSLVNKLRISHLC